MTSLYNKSSEFFLYFIIEVTLTLMRLDFFHAIAFLSLLYVQTFKQKHFASRTRHRPIYLKAYDWLFKNVLERFLWILLVSLNRSYIQYELRWIIKHCIGQSYDWHEWHDETAGQALNWLNEMIKYWCSLFSFFIII